MPPGRGLRTDRDREQRDARNGFFGGCAHTLELAPGAQALAEHLVQQSDRALGPCAATFEDPRGGRIVALAYTPWLLTQSWAKHRQWRQLVAWLGAGRPLAWIEDPFRVCPFVRADGRRWSILLLNVSMETTAPLHLWLSSAVTRASVYGPRGRASPLVPQSRPQGCALPLPAMGPWSFHWVSAQG